MYYVAFSRLETHEALLGQTQFYAAESRYVVIVPVDITRAITLKANIQLLTGACPWDCGTTRGFCTVSGCSCNEGWAGEHCETATCEPECLHGECKGPNTCSCSSGWSGQVRPRQPLAAPLV